MRTARVQGVTADGSALLLRVGDETVVLALAEVSPADQPPAPDAPPADGRVTPAAPALAGRGAPAGPPPTPREIQQRIRTGESSAGIAAGCGLPVAAVARYEGPVLAERAHQAAAAQRADVEGRPVGELVAEHLARLGARPEATEWDSWLVEAGRWEVVARSGGAAVRLGWDPRARRVRALDETGRQALRLAPQAEDALGAVLRPLAGRPVSVRDTPVARPASSRRNRAKIPLWSEISTEVAGRIGERRVEPPEG